MCAEQQQITALYLSYDFCTKVLLYMTQKEGYCMIPCRDDSCLVTLVLGHLSQDF